MSSGSLTRSSVAFGLAALWLGAGCSEGDDAGSGEPASPSLSPAGPDVVVITIDTLRPDHLSFFGYERDTAPFLARLAGRGRLFQRAYSTSSWTAPSTASIFTGHYPHQHGVVEGFMARARREMEFDGDSTAVVSLTRLPRDMISLPRVFQEAGYRTYGLAANPNIGTHMGFDRHFDGFDLEDDQSCEEIARKLRDWKEEIRQDDGPYFLYLHFNDVHAPYVAHDPWYEAGGDSLQDDVARYDSEIRFLDHHLESLYEEFGWGEDTLVAVLSDHGEEFRDHGRLGHPFSLFEELTRVLFLVSGPGVEPGICDRVVSLVDLLPTLAEHLGLGPVETAGTSLHPLLRGEREGEEIDDRVVFSHRAKGGVDGVHLWAAVRNEEKLIAQGSREMLFDLARDPVERIDLLKRDRSLGASLRAALAALREEGVRDHSERVEVALSDAQIEMLRELGYVEDESDRESTPRDEGD